MNKIGLIISREYTTRVKKKSFLVMSVIGPLLFAAMFVLPAWLASLDSTSEKHIAVIDHTRKYKDAISNTEFMKFTWLDETNENNLKSNFKNMGYDAYVIISDDLLKNPDAVKIYSETPVTIDMKQHVRNDLEKFLEKEKLKSFNIDGLDEIIADINSTKVHVSTIQLGEKGTEKESSTELTMIAAIVFAMLIYFFVLMYGTQVMRGVVEEKTNRIVEVIISSVKPFQLMMGKIIGIAMVALTQFLLWVIFTIIIITGIKFAVFPDGEMPTRMDKQIEVVQAQQGDDENAATNSDFAKEFTKIMEKAQAIDIAGSILAFFFFFIAGYLLYAGLYAAVGAVIDNETDSQQFVMPIIMPLILSIYIAMAAFRDPSSDIAFWFSMIPFTSPIVMMARIPFQIPMWQVILSMAILTVSFIFTTWFAGRIYRTGILMYGKKITYKEIWKWFRYSGK
ncbi:MAG: ABC transporter permease [Chlorobi bacterium]|nr:ABC transporter permease [Chlorobiota bacterium]